MANVTVTLTSDMALSDNGGDQRGNINMNTLTLGSTGDGTGETRPRNIYMMYLIKF